MKSGRMVERRDQVLIGRLSFVARTASTFFSRWRSTNGPFLSERAITPYPLFRKATAYDHIVGTLVATGTEALSRGTTRANRHATFTSTTFTTTVRVIHRVHGSTTNGRTDTAPAVSTGFTDLAQAVLFVAHFANSGAAVNVNLADLAGAQTQLGVNAFAGQQHGGGASGTCNLGAFARLQFDAVDGGTYRDVADRQGVTSLDRRFGTRHQLGTRLHAARSDDVAALTVCVAQQSDVGGTVRIVFDALNFSRDGVFVATEVYDTVVLLMTTTLVAGSDVTVVVTASSRRFLFNQRCERSAFVQVRMYDLNNGTTTSGSRFHFY